MNAWTWLGERPTRWDRFDTAVVVAAVLAVLARWRDRAHYLLTWDANTFALALEDYDVSALRPHAPGYPVYVAIARLAYAVIGEANAALVATSLLFTALAAMLAYALVCEMSTRAHALAATLLLLAAPVVYVHSVTANSYSADLACTLAVAWLAWRSHQAPTPRRVALLAAVLALAIGIRQSNALFLAPVAVWGALRPPWDVRIQARRLVPGAILGAAIVAAWFVPMVRLSGGLSAWRNANALQSQEVVFARTFWNSGWPALQENVERLLLFLHWEVRLVLPVLMLLLGTALAIRGRRRVPAAPGAPWTFLALWALPGLFFYATVWSGYDVEPSGYILVVWPPLVLAAVLAGGWSLHVISQAVARRLRPSDEVRWMQASAGRRGDAAAETRGWVGTTPRGDRRTGTPWEPRRILTSLAVAALAVPLVGFVGHTHDVIDMQYKEHDAWSEAWSHLDESYPPSNSTIVTLWSFAHVAWHFPNYTVYNWRPPAQGPGEVPDFLLVQVAHEREIVPDWYDAVAAGPTDERHPLPEGTRHLVLFDFQLAGENGGPRRLAPELEYREDFLPNGWRVLVVDTVPQRTALEDYFVL